VSSRSSRCRRTVLSRLVAGFAIALAGCWIVEPVTRVGTVVVQLVGNQQAAGFSAELEVTGPGVDPAVTAIAFFDTAGFATARLEVPVGSPRFLTIRIFDPVRTLIARSVDTISVAAGANAPVEPRIVRSGGSVPIVIVLGELGVQVTPPTATVRAGDTLALAAAVVDATGQPVPGITVAWATARPPTAFVRLTGVVVALDTGTVQIAAMVGDATQRGLVARIPVTVTPGTVLDRVLVTPDSARTGETVRLDADVRDAGPGVDSVTLGFTAVTGGSLTCTTRAPLAGTRSSGRFPCLLTIPAATAAGDWTLTSATVFAGAVVVPHDAERLRARGVSATLKVLP
jgi:hypothetical protein